MKHESIRRTVFAAVLFLATAAIALWAWNTLSALAGLPAAEFRHALAAFALLAMLRWWLLPGRSRRHAVRKLRTAGRLT